MYSLTRKFGAGVSGMRGVAILASSGDEPCVLFLGRRSTPRSWAKDSSELEEYDGTCRDIFEPGRGGVECGGVARPPCVCMIVDYE